MQQRQLRLGDILDDYCPRERRITNHAVVAMIEDRVKQTRCTTCDTEHEFKQARLPTLRKRKDGPASLYTQVAAGMPKKAVGAGAPSTPAVAAPASEPLQADSLEASGPTSPAAVPEPEAPPPGENLDDGDGPVHRPLIRATLPRPEGQAPVRPAPDFTVRQPGARPARFRPGGDRGSQRHNRPPGHATQPQGGPKGPGMRPGPGGRHTNRQDPFANRAGARPAHQQRSSHHPGGPIARTGKKRSK